VIRRSVKVGGMRCGCCTFLLHLTPGAQFCLSAVPGRGQQGQERADPVAFLGRMAEQAVVVHGVACTAADPGAGDIAGGHQIGHDGLRGAFGNAGRCGEPREARQHITAR
jgi:hypothetical protein